MAVSSIHSQQESRLLNLPLEIRREIYSHFTIDSQIHLFLREGKLRISTCLEPSLGDHVHDGSERRNIRGKEGVSYSNPEWARHLASSWGPHWACEVNASRVNSGQELYNIYDLRNLCKKMLIDVFDLITETSTISITDLDTLDLLTSGQPNLQTDRDCQWGVWNHMQCRIKNLDISLRLPSAFYKALEDNKVAEQKSVISSSTTAQVARMCRAWTRIWPSLCHLQQLQSIHILLDHDDPSSWSVIKEKLILNYSFMIFQQEMQVRSSRKDFSQLSVLFNLPKLHPAIAKAETHFVQDTSPPPLKIERRYRQRYHCVTSDDGTLSVKHNPDFPIMHEIADLYANECLEDLSMTLEEFEDAERTMWLRGTTWRRQFVKSTGLMEFMFVIQCS